MAYHEATADKTRCFSVHRFAFWMFQNRWLPGLMALPHIPLLARVWQVMRVDGGSGLSRHWFRALAQISSRRRGMAARSRRRRCRGGEEWGVGLHLLSRLGGLGKRRKLSQRGPGRNPGLKRVLVYSELEWTHVVTTNLVFLAEGNGERVQRGYIFLYRCKLRNFFPILKT